MIKVSDVWHHYGVNPGLMPPINIMGRIKTRRLIIPAYDRVFIAPVLCLGLWLSYRFLLGTEFAALTLFLVLFIAIYSPDYWKWRITAPIRMKLMQPYDDEKRANQQKTLGKEVTSFIKFGR